MMTFDITMTDVESFAQARVLSMPKDWIDMDDWAKANVDEAETSEIAANLHRNYALAWFVMKRRDRLGQLGLPGELTLEAIGEMEGRIDLDINEVEGGRVLPLAQELAK